jgi:hypothetical protein
LRVKSEYVSDLCYSKMDKNYQRVLKEEPVMRYKANQWTNKTSYKK